MQEPTDLDVALVAQALRRVGLQTLHDPYAVTSALQKRFGDQFLETFNAIKDDDDALISLIEDVCPLPQKKSRGKLAAIGNVFSGAATRFGLKRMDEHGKTE